MAPDKSLTLKHLLEKSVVWLPFHSDFEAVSAQHTRHTARSWCSEHLILGQHLLICVAISAHRTPPVSALSLPQIAPIQPVPQKKERTAATKKRKEWSGKLSINQISWGYFHFSLHFGCSLPFFWLQQMLCQERFLTLYTFLMGRIAPGIYALSCTKHYQKRYAYTT